MEKMYTDYITYQLSHTSQPITDLEIWVTNAEQNIQDRLNNPGIFGDEHKTSKKETTKK